MTIENNQKRILLTRRIMQLLDDWGTNGHQKIVLLGLPEDIKARKLERYRQDEPFPENDKVDEHLQHILGIADALRTSFPRNVEMCSLWLNKPHKRFSNEKPMDVMLNKGLSGIIQVRSQLDCSFAWYTTGSI